MERAIDAGPDTTGLRWQGMVTEVNSSQHELDVFDDVSQVFPCSLALALPHSLARFLSRVKRRDGGMRWWCVEGMRREGRGCRGIARCLSYTRPALLSLAASAPCSPS
eukprot:1740666-Rhodomonas_salina.1